MKNNGQTTIELLLILVVSMVALSIIFSLYSEQVYQTNTQRDAFIVKNSVQKLVNAANTAYAAGVGSEIMVNLEIPTIVDLSETYVNGNVISMKLYNGSVITAIADVNLSGTFASGHGKFVVYLVYDGNSVNFFYNDFELNQRNISFSTYPSSLYSDSIIVRNNSSQAITFFIEKNFSHSAITLDVNTDSFIIESGEIKTIDMNFDVSQNAYGNYSGNINIVGEINGANISKSVSISVESIVAFEELMLYPYSTSFTTYGNESVEKSFSICNKSLTDFSSLTWDFYGVSGDGNIISWIETLDEVTQITDVNSGECISFDLSFIVPLVDSGEYDANIVVNYTNSSSEIDSYTSYLNVEILEPTGYSYYFKSVFENNLNANYFLSNFVKKTSNKIIPTGELDWNNLARNDTTESLVDNNKIYYGRELDSKNYLFNENLVGLWHLNGDAIDSSEYNNNGSWSGTETYTNGLWDTNAGYFDGASYINLGDVIDMGLSDLSVCAWIFNNGENVDYAGIVSKSYYGFEEGRWSLSITSSNQLVGLIHDGSGYSSDTSLGSVPTNEWSHVCLIFDRSNLASAYINNILTGTFDISLRQGDLDTSRYLLIGGYSSADAFNVRKFNGLIEEVVIWNRALSEDEVESLYSSQNQNFREDVIGLWNLDGDAVDSSASDNDGSWVGSESYDNGLCGNNSASFDGTNYIEIPSESDYDLNELTISAWVNYSSLTSQNQGIISKYWNYGSFASNRSYTLVLSNVGKIIFWYSENGSTPLSLTSTNTLIPNKWYHVVVTFKSNDSVQLYINGIISNSLTSGVVSSLFNNDDLLRIGVDFDLGSSDRFFRGKIQNASVWDRSLLEQEIKELYESQKGTWFDENLVLYYNFNDYSGNILPDEARGYDGTLTGTASISSSGLWDSNALLLANNGGVTTNYGSDLNPSTQPISITAWVKSDLPSSAKIPFSFSSGTGTNQRIYVGHNGGNWTMGIQATGWSGGTVSSSTNWTHLAFLMDGSNAKLYVNGELSREIPYTSFTTYGSFGLSLFGAYLWDGLIDEVKIYEKALSYEEIISDYNSFLEAKFIDNNIVDAEKTVNWNLLKINSELNYNFGNEIIENNYLFDENLIGLWHLNNNVFDFSYKENNGSWSGTESYDDGLWDTNSGSFNGSSFVSVSSSNFGSITARTISAWINTTSTATGGNTIMSRIQPASPYDGFTLNVGRNTAGRLAYFSGSAWRESDSTNYNTGEWIHVVVVHDGTDITIYRNGVEDGTFTGVAISSFDTNFLIGKERDSAPRLFNGKIEDVAIWDRALTNEEVLDLYYVQDVSVSRNNIGIWHLNGDANDYSGRNYHGTNSNVNLEATGLWETNAGEFNGSNSFISAEVPASSFVNGFSMSAWINPKSDGVSGYGRIFDKSSATNGGNGFYTYYRLGLISSNINNGGTRSSAANAISLNRWQHVVVTVEQDSTISTYVNGVLSGAPGTSGALSGITTTNPFTIGNRSAATDRGFDGLIDDAVLWNRVLSADEIFDLFEKSSKKIDLNIYSCSDENCENKTSTQQILNTKNNYDYSLLLNNSRYLGWQASFEQVEGLEYLNFNELQSPFIMDVNISNTT